MNICAFVGNVANDPEIRGSNSTVLTFRLAVNGRAYNAETGAWEDDVSYFSMAMFGNRAAAISKWLAKGQMIAVQAHAKQNTWTDADGNNRSTVEFVVDDLVAAPKK